MIFKGDALRMMFELIGGIHIQFRRGVNRILKENELTYAQFGALTALSMSGEKGERMNQTMLAERLETDTTNIMVICNGLEKKGFIRREHRGGNRRANTIQLTDAGQKAWLKAMPLIENYFRPFVGCLTDQEVEQAVPVLQKVYDIISDSEDE
jgi:DNA-binding MarR family transcriptional regulator